MSSSENESDEYESNSDIEEAEEKVVKVKKNKIKTRTLKQLTEIANLYNISIYNEKGIKLDRLELHKKLEFLKLNKKPTKEKEKTFKKIIKADLETKLEKLKKAKKTDKQQQKLETVTYTLEKIKQSERDQQKIKDRERFVKEEIIISDIMYTLKDLNNDQLLEKIDSLTSEIDSFPLFFGMKSFFEKNSEISKTIISFFSLFEKVKKECLKDVINAYLKKMSTNHYSRLLFYSVLEKKCMKEDTYDEEYTIEIQNFKNLEYSFLTSFELEKLKKINIEETSLKRNKLKELKELRELKKYKITQYKEFTKNSKDSLEFERELDLFEKQEKELLGWLDAFRKEKARKSTSDAEETLKTNKLEELKKLRELKKYKIAEYKEFTKKSKVYLEFERELDLFEKQEKELLVWLETYRKENTFKSKLEKQIKLLKNKLTVLPQKDEIIIKKLKDAIHLLLLDPFSFTKEMDSENITGRFLVDDPFNKKYTLLDIDQILDPKKMSEKKLNLEEFLYNENAKLDELYNLLLKIGENIDVDSEFFKEISTLKLDYKRKWDSIQLETFRALFRHLKTKNPGFSTTVESIIKRQQQVYELSISLVKKINKMIDDLKDKNIEYLIFTQEYIEIIDENKREKELINMLRTVRETKETIKSKLKIILDAETEIYVQLKKKENENVDDLMSNLQLLLRQKKEYDMEPLLKEEKDIMDEIKQIEQTKIERDKEKYKKMLESKNLKETNILDQILDLEKMSEKIKKTIKDLEFKLKINEKYLNLDKTKKELEERLKIIEGLKEDAPKDEAENLDTEKVKISQKLDYILSGLKGVDIETLLFEKTEITEKLKELKQRQTQESPQDILKKLIVFEKMYEKINVDAQQIPLKTLKKITLEDFQKQVTNTLFSSSFEKASKLIEKYNIIDLAEFKKFKLEYEKEKKKMPNKEYLELDKKIQELKKNEKDEYRQKLDKLIKENREIFEKGKLELDTKYQNLKKLEKDIQQKFDFSQLKVEPKEIRLKQFKENCMKNYSKKPWVRNYTGTFYVKFLCKNENAPLEFFGDSSQIGDGFQKGSKYLDLVMCKRTQVDNIIKFTYEEEEYEVFVKYEVLLTLPTGKYQIAYIDNDEGMYQKELEWIEKEKDNSEQKIKDFSKSLVKDNFLEQFIFSQLSVFFEVDNANYLAKKIIVENQDDTVENLFKKLGELVIFLDPMYMKQEAVKFNSLLKDGYVNEKELLSMSTLDKIYDLLEANPTKLDIISAKIHKSIEHYAQKTILDFLKIHKLIKEGELYTFDLKTLSYKTLYELYNKRECSNKNSISDSDLIYYIEDDKLWCFSLKELLLSKNPINTYTQKDFSKNFLDFLSFLRIPKEIEIKIDKKELPSLLNKLYEDLKEKDKALKEIPRDRLTESIYKEKILAQSEDDEVPEPPEDDDEVPEPPEDDDEVPEPPEYDESLFDTEEDDE